MPATRHPLPLAATLILSLMGLVLALASVRESVGQTAPEAMTTEGAAEILSRLDDAAEVSDDARVARITIGETPVLYVSDPERDRMRLMADIAPADDLSEADLRRIAEANFDTALDARYAIARGRLWSVFIHPLGALDERQLIAAVGQVVNAATSYGTSYSSGLLTFGGGDTAERQRRALIDELLDRGERI